MLLEVADLFDDAGTGSSQVLVISTFAVPALQLTQFWFRLLPAILPLVAQLSRNYQMQCGSRLGKNRQFRQPVLRLGCGGVSTCGRVLERFENRRTVFWCCCAWRTLSLAFSSKTLNTSFGIYFPINVTGAPCTNGTGFQLESGSFLMAVLIMKTERCLFHWGGGAAIG